MQTPPDSMILNRTDFTDKSTIGNLWLDNAFQCYLLEPSCRAFPGQPLAIPQGKYELVMYESPKLLAKVAIWKSQGKQISPRLAEGKVPLLLKVPGHSYVEIHPGNSPADTEDCFLSGLAKDTDYVMNSRAAWEALITKIEIKLSVGKFYIGITEGAPNA